MTLRFEETQIEKILSQYHEVIGIGIGFYDKHYKPISLMPKHGWSFCNIIRQNKEVYRKCQLCDQKGFEMVKKTKELYVYKCHMGLYEAIAPIIDNQNIIGYIMVGQLLDQQALDYQWTNIKHKCSKYGFMESTYKDAFYNLKQMSPSKIEAAASIMHACAAYLCYRNIVHIERSGLYDRIHQHLIDNLLGDITQDLVCQHFKISKSTLYNTLYEYTSMSLIPYVRQLRLEKAKTLLLDTSLQIKKVAEYCGIEDYNYFSRLFKKTYHCTPSEYRKNLQKT